jgi:hypothetical protein
MKTLNALQLVTRAPQIQGPVGTTAYLIPPERMEEARRLADLFEEMKDALALCETVLSQLQDRMPLAGEAQIIMAQGYAGVVVSRARAVLAKLDRKETPCPETPTR